MEKEAMQVVHDFSEGEMVFFEEDTHLVLLSLVKEV